jgi:hypothetical protein
MAAWVLAGLALSPAAAQQAAPAAPAAPAADPVAAIPPEHLAAARDFLVTSGATKGFEDMIPQFLDQGRLRYVAQRPELEKMIDDVALGLVPEIVKQRDVLNDKLAALYTTQFSIDELKEIAAFYHTPVGQKLAANQVKILQASVPVVQAWSRGLSELVARRIKEEVAKQGQKL